MPNKGVCGYVRPSVRPASDSLNRCIAPESVIGTGILWDSRGHSASPIAEVPALGIPVPSRLTREQIEACERFSLAVWGVTLFDHEPSHNGRHGYACPDCVGALEEQRRLAAEARRKRQIQQPWEMVA